LERKGERESGTLSDIPCIKVLHEWHRNLAYWRVAHLLNGWSIVKRAYNQKNATW